MTDEYLHALLHTFAEMLPAFPDGRIDYTHATEAPILTCFVEHNGKILLLKRSEKVGMYRNKWNTVAGFLDEVQMPLWKKVMEELEEELGITPPLVQSLIRAEPYSVHDEAHGKTWHIFPVLALLHIEPEITLDWEHTEYVWIDPAEMEKYDHTPDLLNNWEHVQAARTRAPQGF
jgi:8-oxo-dGTP diphosphatase